MLNKSSSSRALTQLNFPPEIHLFASRLNAQFTRYVAYRPDPGAVAIDAFSLDLLTYLGPSLPMEHRPSTTLRQRTLFWDVLAALV